MLNSIELAGEVLAALEWVQSLAFVVAVDVIGIMVIFVRFGGEESSV